MPISSDVPREGNRLLAVRFLSNGSRLESPSMKFLIMNNLPHRVEIRNFSIEEVVEYASTEVRGLWFADIAHPVFDQNRPKGVWDWCRLFAFEDKDDALMFKLRFG